MNALFVCQGAGRFLHVDQRCLAWKKCARGKPYFLEERSCYEKHRIRSIQRLPDRVGIEGQAETEVDMLAGQSGMHANSLAPNRSAESLRQSQNLVPSARSGDPVADHDRWPLPL